MIGKDQVSINENYELMNCISVMEIVVEDVMTQIHGKLLG